MMDNYRPRTRTFEAVQYDGSKANAYEILGFVYRHNGKGGLDQSTNNFREDGFLLRIDGIPGAIAEGSWIIHGVGSHFACMTDYEFSESYELVPAYPQPRASILGGGGGGGFGIDRKL